MLRSQQRRIIICASRQSGKSDTVAIRALHRAVYFPKSTILIISPSERQSIEVLHKINSHRKKLELRERPVEDNKLSLELDNRSRILSLPSSEKTIRGYSAVDLLIEDEAGDVPDELYESLEPMLQVSRGTQILMGTPKGVRGHFHRFWHDTPKKKARQWEKVFSNVWNNPRVDHEEIAALKEEKTRLGQLFWFQQEYECAFLASGQGLVYPYDQTLNILPRRHPLHPQAGWQFSLGIDFGLVDSTAFVVLGWRKDDPVLYVVESFKKRGLLPQEAAIIARELTKKYPFARIVGDAGGLGKPYVEEARRRFRLPIEAAEKTNKRGFIELLVGDLKAGNIKVFPGNEDLLAEWQILPWDENRQLPADGYEDHLADACLYAWRATASYLESARQAPPKRGTTEYDRAEADEMFTRRMEEIQAAKQEDGLWQVADQNQSFFN